MKEEHKHSELIELTIKKLANEASESELAELAVLVQKSDENRKTFQDIEKTWELAERGDGITDLEVQEEWQRLTEAIGQSQKEEKKVSIFRIAASVAFLVVASWAIYFMTRESETVLQADVIHEEILEDGSSVTLNVDAVLSYDSDFNDHTREVSLEGEAFFDVESNDSKPFIIHTRGLDITVVGTSFNVKAINNQATSEVVVSSGIVKLSSNDKSIQLVAGEKGTIIRKSGKLFKSNINDPNFLSWKTQNFEFKDTPLQEVIDLLNEVYDQNLYIENTQLQNCPITVSFNNQSFKSILRILETTLDLSIKETTKGMLIDGENC